VSADIGITGTYNGMVLTLDVPIRLRDDAPSVTGDVTLTVTSKPKTAADPWDLMATSPIDIQRPGSVAHVKFSTKQISWTAIGCSASASTCQIVTDFRFAMKTPETLSMNMNLSTIALTVTKSAPVQQTAPIH
jgi:hypothetical protein